MFVLDDMTPHQGCKIVKHGHIVTGKVYPVKERDGWPADTLMQEAYSAQMEIKNQTRLIYNNNANRPWRTAPQERSRCDGQYLVDIVTHILYHPGNWEWITTFKIWHQLAPPHDVLMYLKVHTSEKERCTRIQSCKVNLSSAFYCWSFLEVIKLLTCY